MECCITWTRLINRPHLGIILPTELATHDLGNADSLGNLSLQGLALGTSGWRGRSCIFFEAHALEHHLVVIRLLAVNHVIVARLERQASAANRRGSPLDRSGRSDGGRGKQSGRRGQGRRRAARMESE